MVTTAIDRCVSATERGSLWPIHDTHGRMFRKTLTFLVGLVFLLGTMLAAQRVQAADYPTRPVSLVVAFTPGGPSDVLARILGSKLEQILGQPFVIDNRPGAGGNIAAEAVAHAAPDGYTLLMGNNAILATNASTLQKDQFRCGDGLRADQPDRIAGQYPGGQSGVAGEIDGRADRARQGQVRASSISPPPVTALAAHLAGELFKAEAKIDIVHVPYKGAAPALQDVIAGHVQMMFATAASVVAHIREGKVRALAVTTLKRTAVLPEHSDHRRARHSGFRCDHLARPGRAGAARRQRS